MNENIDLTKILKDCPKGTKFYSMIFGEVKFVKISNNPKLVYFTSHQGAFSTFENGKLYHDEGECILFPFKEQRDWSKFVPTWETKKDVVKVTLHPFDKVLAWSVQPETWVVDIFSHYDSDNILPIWCIGGFRGEVIPYNKDTVHLLGTSDKPEVEYEIEFSKEFKDD
jgi:hypothetical protein